MFYISYAQFNPNNIIRCDKHTACGWMGAFKNQTHCLWTDLGSYDSLQDFGIGGGREDLESQLEEKLLLLFFLFLTTNSSQVQQVTPLAMVALSLVGTIQLIFSHQEYYIVLCCDNGA